MRFIFQYNEKDTDNHENPDDPDKTSINPVPCITLYFPSGEKLKDFFQEIAEFIDCVLNGGRGGVEAGYRQMKFSKQFGERVETDLYYLLNDLAEYEDEPGLQCDMEFLSDIAESILQREKDDDDWSQVYYSNISLGNGRYSIYPLQQTTGF